MNRACQLFAQAAAAALVLTVGAPKALAQEFPEVVDRDYALDLYSGNAIGSNEIVSMGGAAVAVARGSAGMTVNPAAPAIRSQTSMRRWDWDVHFDALGNVAGNDFDNNGVEDEASGIRPQLTFGAVGIVGTWALGIAYSSVSTEADSPTGSELLASGTAVQLHLAKTLFDNQLIVGGGFRGSTFSVEEGDTDLFALGATAIEAGVVWAPKNKSYRLGAAGSFPATGQTVEVDQCDPMNCAGLILPERFEVPWSAAVGVGWRRAPIRWNSKVSTRFIDQKDLTLALDVRVTGSVRDGHGIGQFAKGRLQRSGDRLAISGRAGAEYTWIPARLRIRGGAYWEPSRFRDPMGGTVSGRAHVTAGADVRIFSFHFFRWYRVRLSFTFDGADKYVNSGLSIGFWH